MSWKSLRGSRKFTPGNNRTLGIAKPDPQRIMNKLTMFFVFFSQKTIQLMTVGDCARSRVQERTTQRCSLTAVLPVSQSVSPSVSPVFVSLLLNCKIIHQMYFYSPGKEDKR